MPGGITLLQSNPSNIPTPGAAHDTLFIDNTQSPNPAPAYKDEFGVTRPLIGGTGSAGPVGPMFPVEDGIEGEAGIGVPGPAGPAGAAAAGGLSLLYDHSGTDQSAGTTTVDSYALASQLTSKDRLYILLTCKSTGNGTSNLRFVNTTDNVILSRGSGNGLTSGQAQNLTQYISQQQGSTTTVDSMYFGFTTATNTATQISECKFFIAFTTPWTGAWTIGLVHDGVAAGGTFAWHLSIYKIAGQ